MGREERGFGWLLGTLVKLLVAAGIIGGPTAYIALPDVRETVNRTVTSLIESGRRTILPRVEPIRAGEGGVSASSEIADHPAEFAADGTTRYWAASPDDRQPALTVSLARTADLGAILFTAGAPGPEFETQPRPKDVLLTFRPSGARVSLTLTDDRAPQRREVDARGVREVVITVLTTHPSPRGNAVSLTEVEFFTKE